MLSQHRLARGTILLTSKSAFSRWRILSVLLLGRDMSCLEMQYFFYFISIAIRDNFINYKIAQITRKVK
jgi:hypothetical protein